MVIRCKNWEEIPSHAQDWVLLDLNHVLFEGKDLALSHRCQGIRHAYKKKWRNEGTYVKHWGNLLRQWRFKLMHPNIPHWIENWKRDGHTVLGLTSHPTGAFGKVKDIGKERLRPLKEFGIEMSQEFRNYIFKNLPFPHPEFKSGVLLSGQQLKGIVLSNFFKRVMRCKNLPKHILFVDDQKSNLESVKKCCEIWKIGFTGILYKPARDHIEINPEMIRAQFDEFERTGIWKGDQMVAEERG
ncbi:MAG: DUF2608 domain-containing protein [Alphaproteobacteria bacterium]|nr:MAG: DUF2608 domain-containing protein [Alphaproteobacteria bacterium]